MANLRTELQRQASGAALQYALMRIESAVIVAGTILLTALLPSPFPGWPVWAWPLLGLLGYGAVVYTSLNDPQTSARVLWQLLRERLKLDEIQDEQLRERVATMCDYVRAIEVDLYRLRRSPNLPSLEAAASGVYDWVEQGALFARYVDTYRRDYRLDERRQELPGLIETLVARLKYEKNQDIIDRLNEEMESLGKDWQSLKLLDAQMRQAETQLGQMVTALARAASTIHVIAAERGLGQDHLPHLQQEIQRHLGQITDLVTQMDRLYADALNKG
ncbi:MAG: hypothetical protein ACP5HG_11230 [Anaerolineae bacterium]